jgi:hypothetical protein
LINGEEVEWISPYSDITTEKLIGMVEGIIKEINKPVVSIKQEFLPFSDNEWQKDLTKENVETLPEKYLEVIKPKISDKI